MIATSPPPSVGLPGLLAAWRKRVPLVVDVRDIWPQAIVESGRLKNPLVIGLFQGIARLLYRAQGWRSVEISGRAVEENAARILELREEAG